MNDHDFGTQLPSSPNVLKSSPYAIGVQQFCSPYFQDFFRSQYQHIITHIIKLVPQLGYMVPQVITFLSSHG